MDVFTIKPLSYCTWTGGASYLLTHKLGKTNLQTHSRHSPRYNMKNRVRETLFNVSQLRHSSPRPLPCRITGIIPETFRCDDFLGVPNKRVIIIIVMIVLLGYYLPGYGQNVVSTSTVGHWDKQALLERGTRLVGGPNMVLWVFSLRPIIRYRRSVSFPAATRAD